MNITISGEHKLSPRFVMNFLKKFICAWLRHSIKVNLIHYLVLVILIGLIDVMLSDLSQYEPLKQTCFSW